MKELVGYKRIKEISDAYINKQGELVQKEIRRKRFLNILGKSFGSKVYYLPLLLVCLIGIQIIGFASTIDAVIQDQNDERLALLVSSFLIGVIPIVTILIVWFILRPRNKKRKRIIVEGIKYQLSDN
jgi:hypothetical protein